MVFPMHVYHVVDLLLVEAIGIPTGTSLSDTLDAIEDTDSILTPLNSILRDECPQYGPE